MLAVKQTTVRETQVREYEQQSPRPRARTRFSLRERISACACLVSCVGVVWFVANQGAKIDRMNYAVDKMQTQIQKTQAENASLSSTVDELMRPGRILGIALGRLHMQHADPVQIQSGSH